MIMSNIGQVALRIENITLNVENITLAIGLNIDRAEIEPLRISRIENKITRTRIILERIIYQME